MLSILSVIAILVISFLIDKPFPVKIFLSFLAVTMFIDCLTSSFSSALLGFERFKLYTILAMGTQLLGTSLGLLVLYIGWGLIGVGISQLVTEIISGVVIAVVVSVMVCRFSLKGAFKRAVMIIKQSAPLGITAILMTIYYRADFIMLSFMKGDQAVGYYNSAYALVNGLLLISVTFSSTLFPRLSGYFSKSPEKLDQLYQTGFKYLLYIGMAAAFGAALLAEPIYDLIYPDSYLPGAVALKILIWALALMFINTLQNALMIARDLKKWLMYLTLAGATANIILNVILIPPYSFKGAAMATVVSETITTIGFLIILRKNLPFKLLGAWLLRLVPAIVLMILSINLTDGMMVIPRMIIGALTFMITLIITGGLNRDDFGTVMGLFSRGRE